MSALIPIMKREYLTRVRTKAFWLSTTLVPLLLLSVIIVPAVIAARSKTRPEPILVVDAIGDFYPVLTMMLDKNRGPQSVAPVRQEPVGNRSLDEIRRQLNERAEKGEIQGYAIVDRKGFEEGEVVYYAKNPSSAMDDDWFRSNFRGAVTRYRLSKLGLKESDIDRVSKGVSLEVRRATNDPNKEGSGLPALFMSLILVVFMYSALIMYGMYVLRGVLEEKTNRIVEVIVASVKPFELMAGKILGIGAVGLTQLLIWTLFGLLATAPQLAVALSISRDVLPRVSGMTLTFFPIFFVLGYFLYATLYAGIGSMFNSDEDAQQMAMIPVMLIVVSFAMFNVVLRNPNGTLALVLSLIPFFAPILMFLRIAIETPPAWQIALSIAIMIGTTILMTWVVGKIYRVGILMYGKKPTLPEIARWLRYA